ncbi:MAG: chemotaxis protein CheB [Candidatus Micrarchaeota archaeon]
MVSVIIVDNSKFMRAMLRKMLSADPEIQIIGEAADGYAAIELIAKKMPEVVTLDLQMPGVDGLTVLARLTKEVPSVRVVVISASTKEGAEASAEALKRGAVGMVQKQSGTASENMDSMKLELLHAVKNAAKAKLMRDVEITDNMLTKTNRLKEDAANPASKVVVICTSTGGPGEIRRIVTMFPNNIPAAVIINQQIHTKFTKILMENLPSTLNDSTALTVNIANEGDVLCEGQVTFVPEGCDIVVNKEDDWLVVHKKPLTGNGGASSDVLLKSVAEACGKGSIGVLITGEGMDGVAGLKSLRQAGGTTIVQDPSWGCPSPEMAKNAVDADNVDHVLMIDKIPKKIMDVLERGDKDGVKEG